MKTQMSFQNACVCDANADQKLTRYCRVHITRRNILLTTNKIVASADRPLASEWMTYFLKAHDSTANH